MLLENMKNRSIFRENQNSNQSVLTSTKHSLTNMLENASIPLLLKGVSKLAVFHFSTEENLLALIFYLLMYLNAKHLKLYEKKHLESVCLK